MAERYVSLTELRQLMIQAHDNIIRSKGKEYAPNVHELQKEIDRLLGGSIVLLSDQIDNYFKELRFNANHHLGLGDIRLTIAQQEEIVQLIEVYYTTNVKFTRNDIERICCDWGKELMHGIQWKYKDTPIRVLFRQWFDNKYPPKPK